MRRERCDVGFYILFKNERIVYVGISRNPLARVEAHWRKGWDFDDIIENGEGPYNLQTALWLEKRLIEKYRPKYNVTHNIGAPGRRLMTGRSRKGGAK